MVEFGRDLWILSSLIPQVRQVHVELDKQLATADDSFFNTST